MSNRNQYMRDYMRSYRVNHPKRPRTDGIPEQVAVRETLESFLLNFDSTTVAAAKIGTDTSTLRKWRRGAELIPVWFCEVLGYQKRGPRNFEFVGRIGFVPTGKRA